MADVKISALPASTTPLAGTEVLPIVQSGSTVQVSVANLTAGRAVSALSLTSTTTLGVTGVSTLTGSVGVGGASAAGIMLNVADPSAPAATVIVGKFVSAAVLSGESASWVKVEKDANYGGAIGGYLTQGVGGGLLLGTQNGSATPTERMRIDSSGNMTVATGNITPSTAAKGINFTANTGAAGKTSQLLNWYEEGTFTPTYTSGLTIVGTPTFTGTYTRVGRLVTVFIEVSSTTSVATGGAVAEICRGLPFTPSSGSATGTVVNGGINSSVGCFFNSVAIYSTGATTPAASIFLTVTYNV